MRRADSLELGMPSKEGWALKDCLSLDLIQKACYILEMMSIHSKVFNVSSDFVALRNIKGHRVIYHKSLSYKEVT